MPIHDMVVYRRGLAIWQSLSIGRDKLQPVDYRSPVKIARALREGRAPLATAPRVSPT